MPLFRGKSPAAKVSEPIAVESAPTVENTGFYRSFLSNDIGVEFAFPLDLSLGFSFPYYSDNQYHVLDFQPNLLLGGKSYITVYLFYLRVTFFAELIGAKGAVSARSYYDVINQNTFCSAIDWTFEALKLKITAQVDVKECDGGIAAVWLDGAIYQCEWKNNYLTYDFYTSDPTEGRYAREGVIRDTQCNN